MTDQDDERPSSEVIADAERSFQIPAELPVLPLRDTVLFPNSFMPLAVAREASVRLVEEANAAGKLIGVFTQREASVEEPMQEDLYPVGTATHIHKMFKLPDGSLRLIVQGLARLALEEVLSTQPYLRGRVRAAAEDSSEDDRLEIGRSHPFGARVSITTDDGVHQRLHADPSGEPGSFPDGQAMAQKFLTLARPVLNGRADQLADAILSLERFDRVATATQLGRQ